VHNSNQLFFAPLREVLSNFSKFFHKSAAVFNYLPVLAILDGRRKIGKSQAWWQGDGGTRRGGNAARKSMRHAAGGLRLRRFPNGGTHVIALMVLAGFGIPGGDEFAIGTLHGAGVAAVGFERVCEAHGQARPGWSQLGSGTGLK
jgi:hypothetical protein